jgi:signal transduction histidine kinase
VLVGDRHGDHAWLAVCGHAKLSAVVGHDVRMGELLLAVAAERSLDAVLRRLVDGARELAGARYAAIGIPDDAGDGFRRFVTSGMSDELIAELGDLPRSHGMLGATLTDPKPYRTRDITRDPRFWGAWPRAHPPMHSFMGIPIVSAGDVIGAFYLTEKRGGGVFDELDERRIAALADHTAVAIENARLREQIRELTLSEERTRLARDLHDALSQTLLGLALTADVAVDAVGSGDGAALKNQLDQIRTLARTARRELRALVDDLRPADLARDGLAATLAKHLDMVGRAFDVEIAVHLDDLDALPDQTQSALLRITQEAVHNAVRHGRPSRVEVHTGRNDGEMVLRICDDGVGFDPPAAVGRGRTMGLVSMRDRAVTLGGRFELRSGPGEGTEIVVRIPGG